MKLRSIAIGILLGFMFGLLHIASVADRDLAKAEERLERIEIATASTESVSNQFMRDADEVLETWEFEDIKPSAPYSTIPLNEEYQIYMEERCAEYGMDFFLAIALMESESNFISDAEGDKEIGGSYGFFQINNVWWQTLSDKGLDVFDDIDNIEAGLMILSGYLDKYQDEAIAIQMFKCGESRGRELLGSGIVLGQCEAVVTRASQIKEEAQQ